MRRTLVTHYIALLRGVNVGGNRKVPMADLKAVLEKLGYGNPRTLLASGNIVFEAKSQGIATLENKMSADLAEAAGLRTDIMIRESADWNAIIAANPYPEQARSDPSHLLIHCFKETPHSDEVKALLKAHKGPELWTVKGREAYVFYGAGMADSKFSLMKAGSNTGRNWNMALKLQAMIAG